MSATTVGCATALALGVLAGVGGTAGAQAGAGNASQVVTRYSVLVAEDRRAGDSGSVAMLVRAAAGGDTALQRIAVRALGRLERAELVERIAPALGAAGPAVRAEAANALGQAVYVVAVERDSAQRGAERVGVVRDILLRRLAAEDAPAVRGVIARTLGRLPYRTSEDVDRAESAIAGEIERLARGAEASARLDAVRGLESLVRSSAKIRPPSRAAVDRMRALVVSDAGGRAGAGAGAGAPAASASRRDADARAEVRRLGLAALTVAGAVDSGVVARASMDPDEQVRRLAVRAAGLATAIEGRRALIERALRDTSAMVRIDAVSMYARHFQAADCAPILRATADASTRVALTAIDLLGGACPATSGAADSLAKIAATLPTLRITDAPISRLGWHAPAHAIVSLARVAPARADSLLRRFASHPIWQARMYAAHAAGVLRAAPVLLVLAADTVDNVREAAVTELSRVRAHDADSVYIAQLGRGDYQLVLAAARALRGSPRAADATRALLASLARITAQRRETSRDPRVALLERIGELGTAAYADSITRYLRDFDPAVAQSAARILSTWTGQQVVASPSPAPAPPPAEGEVASLEGTTLRVTMAKSAGGGTFELELLADEAPLTIARVVRLAKRGYYDGLTFHRVLPNFVIQGGSPGANEYTGDGPFMRDEVGLRSHERGTLGISTRGRDTGDAQLFVNLVHNPRLDHAYTVFAVVTAGMPVVDDVLEGDVIERVTVVAPSSRRP